MNVVKLNSQNVNTIEINDLINRLLSIKIQLGKKLNIPSKELHNEENSDFRIITIVKLQVAIFSLSCFALYNPESDPHRFTEDQKNFIKVNNVTDIKATELMQGFLANAFIDSTYFAFDYLFSNLHFYIKKENITYKDFLKEYYSNSMNFLVLELLSYWRNTLHNNGYSKTDKDIGLDNEIFEFKKNKKFQYFFPQLFNPLFSNLISALENILFHNQLFQKESLNGLLPEHFTINSDSIN